MNSNGNSKDSCKAVVRADDAMLMSRIEIVEAGEEGGL
jgi:hypothetical protein